MKKIRLESIFRIEKLFSRGLTLLVVLTLSVSNIFAQSTKINLQCDNSKISDVLREIESKTDYLFFYNNKEIKPDTKVTIKATNQTVASILDQMFKNTNVKYSLVDKHIILSPNIPTKSVEAQAQQGEIKKNRLIGRVIDASDSEPLAFAVVQVKGTSIGTRTDIEGRFSIDAKVGQVLTISYLGYAPSEIQVGDNKNVEIAMKSSNTELNEVVVTALGVKREIKSLGYVTQKMDGDQIQKVKGTNIATSLTGRIAGLQVLNSPEFMSSPKVTIRGASPLLVLDGVPCENMNLGDINQDDIESMDILKGAAASALYGSRGGSGAIMITTKRGAGQKGFKLSVSTSNMFNLGTLALPENQGSYSAGLNGKYNIDNLDYVWGDKLDIGRVAKQWDPIAKEMREFELRSVGKDNFKNFLEFSYISNTNISVTQTGEHGSIRSSLSYLRNKGQYPNALSQQVGYNISGTMKLGDKVNVDGSIGFNKRTAPNDSGTGYNNQGYIYTLLIWTGPEYDLRDYRDYWVTPDQKQNWLYRGWYDNPYMAAYEKLNTIDNNKLNAMLSISYKFGDWGKLMLRSGYDFYSNNNQRRAPIGINSTRLWGGSLGYYYKNISSGYSTNNDIIYTSNHKIGKLRIDALAGGTLYMIQDQYFNAKTRGGITVPGFYSLAASVDSPEVSQYLQRKGVNSVYAKAGFDYDSKVYLDITARNDWSSTLPSNDRSYFYPSIGGSVVMTEILNLPKWVPFWKLRASWAINKRDLGIYAINSDYGTATNVWDGMNIAQYPKSIRGEVKPITDRTIEVGTAMSFLSGILNLDFTYYNKYTYNITSNSSISELSGFTGKLVNIDEEYVRKGVEIMLDAKIISKGDFKWKAATNWSTSRRYYKKLDEQYSADAPWVKVGGRTDAMATREFLKDDVGNIIHSNGYPQRSSYNTVIGYADPDWNWGLINTFTYKGFNLNISIDGRIGGRSYSGTERNMWTTGAHPDTDNEWRYQEVVEGKKNYNGGGVKVASGTVIYDSYGNITKDTRVYEPNDVNVSYQNYIRTHWVNGPQFYMDETFLKLRELSLTYDIPKGVAKKLGMTSASASLIGQNLLLFTKEFKYTDPDGKSDDLASPSVRYVGFNLTLNF